MDQPDTTPVVWLYAPAQSRQAAGELKARLAERATVLILGSGGQPPPDLELGPHPDLARALESCPEDLRPHVLVRFDGQGAPAPPAEGLPCPCVEPGPGGPAETAGRALAAAAAGQEFAWLPAVQVNLPLADLLGKYRHLLDLPLNPEVGLSADSLERLGPGDLDRAREMLAGRRLTSHLPFLDLAPGSCDRLVAEAAARRLEQAADWAIALGAGQAVIHLGFEPHLHRNREAFARRLADNLGPLAGRLQAAGIALAMENVFEPDPRPLLLARRALARTGCATVGFCLDIGHALAFSRTSLDAWWEALAPHLRELHLHDNDRSDDQHLPPGRGAADWAMLGRRLSAMSRWPVITLEPHRESHLWESLRALERLWGAPAGMK